MITAPTWARPGGTLVGGGLSIVVVDWRRAMSDVPSPKDLSAAQKGAFWRALKAVAYTDGELREKEPARLRDWAKRMGIEADIANRPKPDIAELTKAFPDAAMRARVFRALCDLATCDGDYHDNEDELLDEIAQEWWPPVGPRVERFTDAQKQALWQGLIHLAWSDRDVSGLERHLLANWARRLQRKPDMEDTRPPSLAETMGVFEKPEEREVVLKALHAFALADGPMKEVERSLLGSLAKRWEMPLPT